MAEESLSGVLDRAVATASPPVSDIARDAGISAVTLRAYRRGERTPDVATTERLAAALEEQARRIREAAAELRRAGARQARGA